MFGHDIIELATRVRYANRIRRAVQILRIASENEGTGREQSERLTLNEIESEASADIRSALNVLADASRNS
jgi:hypothetical protein